MVGVSCALELQRRGCQVTLIDRLLPGQETSYGNAGVIARSSLIPLNNPGLWAALPQLLRNRSVQFRYRAQFVLRNRAWVAGFLAAARQSVFETSTAALDALIRLSTSEHLRLLGEAQALGHVRDNGWIFLYRSAEAFARASLARTTFARFAIATETLDRQGLSDLEPHLRPIFERALWIKDSLSVDDPGAVVAAYARLFADRGGRIERAEVAQLSPVAQGWQAQDGAGRRWQAQHMVVALGPWSPRVLAPLGLRVPMAFERGYHMHYGAQGEAQLQRPVYDSAGGYVLSPMAQGLRLCTGVELADCDAPPNLAQLDLAEQAARCAFALGPRLQAEAWLGRRPTLPDSRPAIGAAPRCPGLWLAFGHQHIGFSTGPGTAALLAALMLGGKAPMDAAPFAPQRCIR